MKKINFLWMIFGAFLLAGVNNGCVILVEAGDYNTERFRIERLNTEASATKDSATEGSDIEDSGIEDSGIQDSDIEDSDIEDSDIEKSGIEDSRIEDSDTEDSTIKDLTDKLNQLDSGYELPDFGTIFSALKSLDFQSVFSTLADWLLRLITEELKESRLFVWELLGVVLFSSMFTTISSSFKQYDVTQSSFLITYILTFSIILSNFAIMSKMYVETVDLFSNALKIIVPAYAVVVSLSGKLTTGVLLYEYLMVVILFVNMICIQFLNPLIHYYLILELINSFTEKKNISRLCEGLYFLLSKGVKLMFFLFFGIHVFESMLAPSVDGTKNSLIQKGIDVIPGAGDIAATVSGTVLNSANLIKNSLGAAVIIFILFLLCLPLVKLVIYIVFYLLLSICLEPIADERLIECMISARKSGQLLLYGLLLCSVLFLCILAVTTFSTNQIL